MIARGLAAILTVRERRHGDRADGPLRCLRCHRELTGKVPPFRGIGRDCWRVMNWTRDHDPYAPTIPTGPDYVLVRDRQGRLHHNVPAKYFPTESTSGIEADPVGLRLACAILRSTGIVRPGWLPHLTPVFYDDFLRGMDADSAIVKGSDIAAWILEHTRRGDL